MKFSKIIIGMTSILVLIIGFVIGGIYVRTACAIIMVVLSIAVMPALHRSKFATSAKWLLLFGIPLTLVLYFMLAPISEKPYTLVAVVITFCIVLPVGLAPAGMVLRQKMITIAATLFAAAVWTSLAIAAVIILRPSILGFALGLMFYGFGMIVVVIVTSAKFIRLQQIQHTRS